MRLSFAMRHALREGRSTWRRIGLYMGSITLGVAALVAINSFRTSVIASVRAESRALLGADLELHSRRPFSEPIVGLLDSLSDAGTAVSFMTTVPSMAYSPNTEFSRLVQIKALEGAFPYYGTIGTDPQEAWNAFREGPKAVVDPAVTIELDIGVGDTILVNEFPLEIAGVITDSPGELSFQGAIGPRVFVSAQHLAAMQLIHFGSLVRFQAYLEIADQEVLDQFIDDHRQLMRAEDVGWDTVAERVDELTFAVGNLTRFLGLVGLIALLLGGVGVASAIHVFIKEKLDTVAVLRCLGARQRTIFAIYLIQAASLGFVGAALGVALGIGVQLVLPGLLRGMIPIDVDLRIDWVIAGIGLCIGIWVAAVFALLPMLTIWDVTPLRALRRDVEAVVPLHRKWRFAAFALLVASVVTISVWQAPRGGTGLLFAGGICGTTAVLWLTARFLIRMTRRYFPRRARYVVRQGVANLFRPQNQTVSVTIALGFGAFLVATIYVVQRNILDRFDLEADESQPNFAAFDIQPDQREGVVSIFDAQSVPVTVTPIIPARMSMLRGRSVEEWLADTVSSTADGRTADSTQPRRVGRWALRREYRHTYRDTLVGTEELTAGTWWDSSTTAGGLEAGPTDQSLSGVARISVEEGLASELNLELGDRITWNIQGQRIESVVTSFRRVNWARMNLNFFVVFEPSSLDRVPQTAITLARVEDPAQRAILQRDLVRHYPNISVIDLSIVQNALQRIVSKVTLAIRFMALFSIASGIIVLIGALSTSRFHRIRESVLLKTLGASKRQIRQIFSTEYITLGSLAGLTGILLAALAGWVLVRFLFELDFRMPAIALAFIWVFVAALTTVIGLASSRTVLAKPPLAVIREISE